MLLKVVEEAEIPNENTAGIVIFNITGALIRYMLWTVMTRLLHWPPFVRSPLSLTFSVCCEMRIISYECCWMSAHWPRTELKLNVLASSRTYEVNTDCNVVCVICLYANFNLKQHCQNHHLRLKRLSLPNKSLYNPARQIVYVALLYLHGNYIVETEASRMARQLLFNRHHRRDTFV